MPALVPELVNMASDPAVSTADLLRRALVQVCGFERVHIEHEAIVAGLYPAVHRGNLELPRAASPEARKAAITRVR